MSNKFKKPKKKAFGDNTTEKQRAKIPPALEANKWEAGKSGNPNGRPKGSRNRFAEAFIQDFLKDWNEHGAAALQKCRQVDVAAYINAATKLLPKDFNINMTSEAELDKFLDQFNDEQLKELLAGLVAVGASAKKEASAEGPGTKPDSLH